MNNLSPALLTDQMRRLLQELCTHLATSYRIARRAQIILYTDQGWSQNAIIKEMQTDRLTVKKWNKWWDRCLRNGFLQQKEECVTDSVLLGRIVDVLSHIPSDERENAIQYSDEQITTITAIVCESPQVCGRDIEFWTMETLADEAARRGIVPYVSAVKLSYEIQRRRR